MSVRNLITGDVFNVTSAPEKDACIIQHHLGLLYIHIDNEVWRYEE